MWGKPYNNGYWGDSRVQFNDLIKQHWLDEINKDFWLKSSKEFFDSLSYPELIPITPIKLFNIY